MKYNIIYVDPPWGFKNKKTGGSLKSGAAAHYKTMSIKEMMVLDIGAIAADDCVLFMWWVGSQPAEALSLVTAWGFKLKTMTGFVWVKRTKLWKLFFGMGFWTRAGSECMLIGIKGKPKRINAGIRSVVEAEATMHSKKPDVFAEQIVSLMGDLPRVELFARDIKPGWASWGNEVLCDIEIK